MLLSALEKHLVREPLLLLHPGIFLPFATRTLSIFRLPRERLPSTCTPCALIGETPSSPSDRFIVAALRSPKIQQAAYLGQNFHQCHYLLQIQRFGWHQFVEGSQELSGCNFC